jgi:hypothetical protein
MSNVNTIGQIMPNTECYSNITSHVSRHIPVTNQLFEIFFLWSGIMDKRGEALPELAILSPGVPKA